MCLAIPAKILSVDGTAAHCEMSGVTKDIDISLTPEAKAGDWVIVHVGFALQVIDAQKAAATLAAMQSVADSASAGAYAGAPTQEEQS